MALIRLEGLSYFGRHGATIGERRVGTRLDVDVEVELETARAETTDRLADTVSYDRIEALVRRTVEDESYRLLEALGARVASRCVRELGVRRCTVALTKQNLAWPAGGVVTVEVVRTAASPRPAGPTGRAAAKSVAPGRGRAKARGR